MEKIVFADRIIAKNAAAKISANDVVLVYGRSSAGVYIREKRLVLPEKRPISCGKSPSWVKRDPILR